MESEDTKRRRRQSARHASARVAASRRCPRCQRKAALSSPVRDEMGRVRECLYCGHQCGTRYGTTFGFDVTPEPGTRERPPEGDGDGNP